MKRKLLTLITLIVSTYIILALISRHSGFYESIYVPVSLDPYYEDRPRTSTNNDEWPNGKVFCLIKSYLKNYRINKTSLIHRVWGRKCDDYRFIMMIPVELRPPEWTSGNEFELLTPLKMLQPKAVTQETHANVTMKIYQAFLSIYKRFPDYPWYYLVDDDSYVNVNNLRKFLHTQDSTKPVTYGYDFKVNKKKRLKNIKGKHLVLAAI